MIIPGLIFALASSWAAIRVWRTGTTRGLSSSPNGEEIGRQGPAAAVIVALGVIGVTVGVVLGQHTTAEKLVIVITFLGAIAAFAVCLTIRFAHRPRWAIPPPLRDPRRGEPGAIEAAHARERARAAAGDDWGIGD
jgi:uncharacterized membrane protein YfcA